MERFITRVTIEEAGDTYFVKAPKDAVQRHDDGSVLRIDGTIWKGELFIGTGFYWSGVVPLIYVEDPIDMYRDGYEIKLYEPKIKEDEVDWTKGQI